MSVELPEAKILAEQMNHELRGKQVKQLRRYRSLALYAEREIHA